jgi:hypothetical protein
VLSLLARQTAPPGHAGAYLSAWPGVSMLSLVINYDRIDGRSFYVYCDEESKRMYLTMSKCYVCNKPHELVDLFIRDPAQRPPYTVYYECPATNITSELIVVFN